MITSHRREILPYAKEAIWNIMVNNEKIAWRSDLSKVEIKDNTHFVEYALNGYPTTFEITKKEPYHEYCFHLQNSNMEGQWQGLLTEIDETTTQVDFTEELHVKNIIMRLLAKGYVKSQQKKYFNDLKKELEKRGSDYHGI